MHSTAYMGEWGTILAYNDPEMVEIDWSYYHGDIASISEIILVDRQNS
jgi:hypothetical protein